MTFEEVRLVRAEPGEYRAPRTRTDPEKALDAIMDAALDSATEAREAAEAAISWLSVVSEVPSRLRNLPTVLAQLVEFIEAEKRVKG